MTKASELESLRNWFDYNAKARMSYLDVLTKLPQEELTRDRGASYPTLLDIFHHSLDGLSSWINRMSVLHDTFVSDYVPPKPPTISSLRRYNEEAGKQVEDFLSHLTEEDLDRTYLVRKTPPWWDEDFTAPVRETLYHLVEHELQHRGELNALLWQIEIEPPIHDWLFDSLASGSEGDKDD